MSCNTNFALVSLLATGAQNEDITNSPEVSLFVYTHRRVTHFSQMIVYSRKSNGENHLACGEQTIEFGRHGDLMNSPYLRFDLPGIANTIKCKTSSFVISKELTLINTLTNTFSSVLRIKQDEISGCHYIEVLQDNDTAFSASVTQNAVGDLKSLYDAVYAYGNTPITTEKILNWYFFQNHVDPLQLVVCWGPDTRSFGYPSKYKRYFPQSSFHIEKNDCFQLIESCEERVRAHTESRLSNKNALTFPGPECYWSWGVGYALAECMTVCIGNQQIDRSYGHWMSMWEELTDAHSNSTDNSLYPDTHVHPNCRTTFKTSVANRKRLSKTRSAVYVPVSFGWARSAALSVPLVACTFNTISVSLRPATLTDLIQNYGPELYERSGINRNWIQNNNSLDLPAGVLDGRTIDCTVSGLLFGPEVQTVVIDSCADRVGEFWDKEVSHGYRVQTKETNIIGHPVRQQDAQVRLVANYVFLQQGERQKFAEGSHEQIIVQAQHYREPIRSCRQTVGGCSFHHPAFGLFASLTADPKTVGVNREPLDGNGLHNSINHVTRPAITHFNISFNNNPCLPSVEGCELARYHDLNAYNKMFRGAASATLNGGVATLFCTDAMRAMIQPCGSVNLSRIDDLCFLVQVAPEILATGEDRERDNHERELSRLDNSNPDAGLIAQSILTEPSWRLSLYATSYNIIRYRMGMANCKWAL